MKTLAILFFIIFSSLVTAQNVVDFNRQLAESGLQFEMPKGFKPTKVIENRDLQYSFAIVNEAGTMEVRYSIFAMKPLLEQYQKSLKEKNMTMIDPNNVHVGINRANGLNMTAGNEPKIGDFPTQAVKKEFNADWGGSSFFELNCSFGKGWKYGQAVYLHKIDTADVIITFMSIDRETHSDLMDVAFHALRFK